MQKVFQFPCQMQRLACRENDEYHNESMILMSYACFSQNFQHTCQTDEIERYIKSTGKMKGKQNLQMVVNDPLFSREAISQYVTTLITSADKIDKTMSNRILQRSRWQQKLKRILRRNVQLVRETMTWKLASYIYLK